ncbi:hypothetical protein FOZ63_003335, partial [Perkinsus olseni]
AWAKMFPTTVRPTYHVYAFAKSEWQRSFKELTYPRRGLVEPGSQPEMCNFVLFTAKDRSRFDLWDSHKSVSGSEPDTPIHYQAQGPVFILAPEEEFGRVDIFDFVRVATSRIWRILKEQFFGPEGALRWGV